MTIAYLVSTSRASSGTTAAGIDTTGANGIFILGAINSGASPTPSDNKGNVYSSAVSISVAAGDTYFFTLFYTANPTVGAGHTFTLTDAFGCAFQVAAFSGLAASSILDTSNSFVGSGFPSSIQPGSITPASANSLIIAAAISRYSGTTFNSVDSGFAFQPAAVAAAGGIFGMTYLIQGAAAAVNPTFTFNQVTVGTNDGAIQASFKPVAAAANTAHFLSMLGVGGTVVLAGAGRALHMAVTNPDPTRRDFFLLRGKSEQ